MGVIPRAGSSPASATGPRDQTAARMERLGLSRGAWRPPLYARPHENASAKRRSGRPKSARHSARQGDTCLALWHLYLPVDMLWSGLQLASPFRAQNFLMSGAGPAGRAAFIQHSPGNSGRRAEAAITRAADHTALPQDGSLLKAYSPSDRPWKLAIQRFNSPRTFRQKAQ